jgi:hypothetical protein
MAKFGPTIAMVGPWAGISRDPGRSHQAISGHILNRNLRDRWFHVATVSTSFSSHYLGGASARAFAFPDTYYLQ